MDRPEPTFEGASEDDVAAEELLSDDDEAALTGAPEVSDDSRVSLASVRVGFPFPWSPRDKWKGASRTLYKRVYLNRPVQSVSSGSIATLTFPDAGPVTWKEWKSPVEPRKAILTVYLDASVYGARITFEWSAKNKSRHASHEIETRLSWFYDDSKHTPVKELGTIDLAGQEIGHGTRVGRTEKLYSKEFLDHSGLLDRDDVQGVLTFAVTRRA